jgi:hypothetical protein
MMLHTSGAIEPIEGLFSGRGSPNRAKILWSLNKGGAQR